MLASFISCVRYYSFISVILSLSGSVLADTLYLNNGDKITGTVLSLNDNKLILSTNYTDHMLVDWKHVERISINRKIVTYFKPDQKLQGPFCLNRARNQFTVDGHTFFGADRVLQLYPLKQNFYGLGWSGDVNVAGKIEHNAADNTDYSFDVSLIHRLGINRHTIGLKAGKTKDNNVETKKIFQFNYDFDRFLTDKWYWNSNYEYQTNAYQDLRKQNILGTSAGYNFVDNAVQSFSIAPGLAYTNQTYNRGIERNDLGWQWKLNYQRKSLLKWLTFFHTEQILLPQFSFKYAYYDIDTGFKLNLPNRIYLQLSYEWKYDNSPYATDYRKDSTTAFGLGYQW